MTPESLTTRRTQLVQDLEAAAQQRDRLAAAVQEAARQVEHFRGALALLDELLRNGTPPAGGAA